MKKKDLTQKLAKYSAAAGALIAAAGTANAGVEIANITFSDGVIDGMLVTKNDTAYIDLNNDGTPEMVVGILSNQDTTYNTYQSSVLGNVFNYRKMGFIQQYGVNLSPTDVGPTATATATNNIKCGVLGEFYWPIGTNAPGDKQGPPSPINIYSNLNSSDSTLAGFPYQFGFVKKLQQGLIIDSNLQQGGIITNNEGFSIAQGDAFSPWGLIQFNTTSSFVPTGSDEQTKMDNFPQHGQHGFAALMFQDGNTNKVNYGWLEMEVNNVKSGSLQPYIKIGNGAIQMLPDEPIAAGDMRTVPFAPIASALGLGLIGLFGYLRRKKEA